MSGWLINKKEDEPLILNNKTVNDKGWRSEFFFVEIVTLENSSGFHSNRWVVEGPTVGQHTVDILIITLF